MSYYTILGVSQTSTPEQIKKAYKKLAIQYHPDKNPDGIEEASIKFKAVTEAYEVLGDSLKKLEYDSKGYVGRRRPSVTPKEPEKPKPKPKSYPWDKPLNFILLAARNPTNSKRELAGHKRSDRRGRA